MLALLQQTVQFSELEDLGGMIKEAHGYAFPYDSLIELHFWLERAIRYGKPFHGPCTRKLFIES